MANKTWVIGILRGFGRRCWQQEEDRITRITEFGFAPTGQAILAKDMLVEMMNGEQQFSAKELVIVAREPRPELKADLDRMYSGSKLIIGNGKLPPLGPMMGPRPMP